MAQGFSGSFAVNGVRFILQPEIGRWIDKDVIGVDGNAFGVYPTYREFEVSWGLAHPNDVKQMLDVFNTAGYTGTTVFDLPEWGTDDYKFKSYSGCVLREPQVGEYFNGYFTGVRFLIVKILT